MSSTTPMPNTVTNLTFLDRAIKLLPTLGVLALLAGIGVWGHHSGWKMPKFSAIAGGSDGAETELWCETHNVAEAECILCESSLLPPVENFGWCTEHGLEPCPLCHPEVVQLKTAPEVSPAELQRVSTALTLRKRPENNPGCPYNGRRVQLASIEAVRKAGIDVELVERRPMVEAIAASGEITYDQTRVAQLSSRVAGSVWRVEKNVGDRVRKGEVLALVDAAAVGRAKAELLDALSNVQFHQSTIARLQPLAKEQIISGSRLLEAETAMQQASIKLRQAQQSLVNLGFAVSLQALEKMDAAERLSHLQFLGLPEAIRDEGGTMTSNLLPIVSPLDGTIIRREVVAGEVVGTEKRLFQLADTTRMWLVFNVAMEDAHHLKPNQTVRFQPDGAAGVVSAKLSWISTDVDRETRTVSVRADLANPDGKLRSETFGLGQIVLRDDPEAIVVPEEAIHWDGNCHVVFVRDKKFFDKDSLKIFHTRSVRKGVTQDGKTEIIAGVWPGEVVVTAGGGMLRSQILKDSLGAGCACGH